MYQSHPEWSAATQYLGTKVDPNSAMKAGPVVKTAGNVVQHVVSAHLTQYLDLLLSQQERPVPWYMSSHREQRILRALHERT